MLSTAWSRRKPNEPARPRQSSRTFTAYRLNTTNASLDNAVVLSSKKILESLLATGAVNRREGVNRLTVDTKWFARADARARASRAEGGRRERGREASGYSNSEHARSICNARKPIRDPNSSESCDLSSS